MMSKTTLPDRAPSEQSPDEVGAQSPINHRWAYPHFLFEKRFQEKICQNSEFYVFIFNS